MTIQQDLASLTSSATALSAALTGRFTKYPQVRVGWFCSTDDELNTLIGKLADQSSAFEKWTRFSHNTSLLFPANPDEITSWSYDSSTGLVHNTTNSTTFIGLASNESYRDYVIDVVVSSSAADDDMIGLLLGFYKDPATGYEHTLSALRSPGGGQPLWGICYNYAQGTPGNQTTVGQRNSAVQWGNGASGALDATTAGYVVNTEGSEWDSFPGGTRIWASRSNDVITVKTSLLTDQTDWLTASEFSIDLTSNPLLTKFAGASPYGFCAYSQANSTWKTNGFTSTGNVIYNIVTGQVYSQDPTGTWVEITGYSLSSLGTNVLLICNETGRSFFMSDVNDIVDLEATVLK